MKKLITLLLLIFFWHLVPAKTLNELLPDKFKNISRPANINSFGPVFHFAPVNQDTTLVCWSFATLSFLETEAERLGYKPVKLAMMYPPYYAFIEKAKYYVQTKGTSRFVPGDLFNTVIDVIRKYGIVPLEVYRGQTDKAVKYNQNELYAQLKAYMNNIKEKELWDETAVVAGVTEILDTYLGKPPIEFSFQGKMYTPISFAAEYLPLPWDDYLLVTSFMYAPYDEFIALNVPDNWRNYDRYLNVGLEEFYKGISSALAGGFSVAIDGDINEPGRYGPLDIDVIPEFDIPSNAINNEAREYRFQKGITEDDHLMHIVGYQNLDGQGWFLVKDSWRDAWQGQLAGYFLYREDYVKLKVLAYLVHKDALPGLVKRNNGN